MAVKRKAAKGGSKISRAVPGKRAAARRGAKLGARAARRNAYLQAVLHNERVHDRLRAGVGSARAAYGRVSRRGKGPEDFLVDRKARQHLGRALVSLQKAGAAIRGAKMRRRRRIGVRAVVPVVAVGGVGALAVNEDLRQKVLGLVSGSSNGSGPAAGSGQAGGAATSESGGTVTTPAPAEKPPPTAQEG